MLDKTDASEQTNRQPWLAASLSWLVPGFGHLYSGAHARGVSLIVLGGCLYILWLMSLISGRTPIIVSLLLNLCMRLMLPIYAATDAFRLTKAHNTADFERQRTLAKDPWLAVFLSLLLPGVGHAYLRKSRLFILYLASFLGVYLISTRFVYTFPLYVLFRAGVCAHAYQAACQAHERMPKRPLAQFALLLVCTYCLMGFLVPQAERHFVMEFYGPGVGSSMEPTVPRHSRGIVDKYTYRLKDPSVGDVVVFAPPNSSHSDVTIPACKRVVAVGGETVQVRNGRVYVNGRERQFVDRTHRQVHPNSSLPIDFSGPDNPYLAHGVDAPYEVPPGHYFVLGDNDRYSVDSRCYGAIPRENIIDRLIKIFWPPRRIVVAG